MSEEAETEIRKEADRVDQERAEKPELFGMGHNVGGVAGDRLRAYIERIERLEEEKAALAEDIKDIYCEVKAVGFEAKIVRKIVRLRKQDSQQRREESELIELYKSAIGME